MSEGLTIKAEAFQDGVSACLAGEPREVPGKHADSHKARSSWIRGYDAARPYRALVEKEPTDHA